MSPFRRRVAVAGVAALALGLGAAGSTIATAGPTPPPSYATSWVALNTGATNTARWVTASADGTTRTTKATQTFKAGKSCSYTTMGASLLGLTSDPLSPGVGLSGGAFGVRESFTSSGASCSAVDYANGETLIVQLNSANLDKLVAGSASLDVDLKQSAQILATAKVGTSVVGYFELRSGDTIVNPVDSGVDLDGLFICNTPADSGPDAGIRNNCRWQISAPTWTSIAEDGIAFDSLELTPLNGSFSLMGGAEGRVDDPNNPMPDYFGTDDTSASLFELVEGVVGCGQTVQLRTSTTVPVSTWNRLDNFGETEEDPCVAYPYVSSSGTLAKSRPFAKILKPLDFQPNSQALWTAAFVIKGNSVPSIIMDLDLLDGTTKTIDPVPDCNQDSTWYDENGLFIGPPVEPTSPTACLVSAARGDTTGTSDQVTYVVYVYGDAQLRR